MNIKDWLKQNPKHRVTLAAAAGDKVRAVLHGGDGIDQRLIGDGDDEAAAITHALEHREMIAGRLSYSEANTP